MHADDRRLLFFVVAIAEGTTSLGLLVVPSLLLALLLGIEQATAPTELVGRVAGAALLAIAVASWIGRRDTFSPTQLGLLTGIFVYNVAVAVLLIYAGTVLKLSGILLWPVALFHAVFSVWCLYCLQGARKLAGTH